MRIAARVVALAALTAGCGINDPADFYLHVEMDDQTWHATSLPNVIAGTFAAKIRPAVLGDVRPPDRRVTGSFRLRMENLQ